MENNRPNVKGSATRINQVIPSNACVEGVPAVVKKENITGKDRDDYFGLIPAEWCRFWASMLDPSGEGEAIDGSG